jgi:hypothetical protein
LLKPAFAHVVRKNRLAAVKVGGGFFVGIVRVKSPYAIAFPLQKWGKPLTSKAKSKAVAFYWFCPLFEGGSLKGWGISFAQLVKVGGGFFVVGFAGDFKTKEE